MVPGHQMPKMAPLPSMLDPNTLAAFVDPLPLLPVAKSAGIRPAPDDARVRLPYYRMPIREIHSKIHRDVSPTRFWSYGSSVPGPVFETRSGEGLLVDWPNELPREHFLPIDHNLMGAEAHQPAVRTVVHLHGAKTAPESDGYPDDWYVSGKSRLYHYPNQQEPALLWYHDHAMGINRLNIYAGMVGLFIIRDKFEDGLNLPNGKYEIPLVIFDRLLTADGQLYYPVSNQPEAPWVPEVFGNAVLVNGKLFPYLDVEPRKYRFRLLNGSNGRFYTLLLGNGQTFFQIGSDQGLLPAPVESKSVFLAPGERSDFIVDFAEHRGEQIVLRNEGFNVLQFRVARAASNDTSSLPKALRPVPRMPASTAIRTRNLALEEFDSILDEPITHLLNGARWHDPITENPLLDSTEIWSFINVTDDSHPIHLHLVRFQILDRRPFDVTEYLIKKQIRYVAEAVPPDPVEAGWKDTVRATPGAVTRIIVRFEGYAGRYVWHCHILEHEDNEMMRPYEVIAGKSGV
jgi:spore coat protein A